MKVADLQFLHGTTLIVYILLKRRSSDFQYCCQYSTKVLWCRRALAIFSKKLFPRGLCQQCIGPHCSSHTWPKVAAMGTSSRWKAAASSFQANYLASLAYLIILLPGFQSISQFVDVCRLYVVLILRRIAGMYIQNDGCRCLMGSISGASM